MPPGRELDDFSVAPLVKALGGDPGHELDADLPEEIVGVLVAALHPLEVDPVRVELIEDRVPEIVLASLLRIFLGV